MSEHTQLAIMLTVWIVIGGISVAFTCWIIWTAFWDVWDYFMQWRTRRRVLRAPSARANRDHYQAWRD